MLSWDDEPDTVVEEIPPLPVVSRTSTLVLGSRCSTVVVRVNEEAPCEPQR